MYPWIEPAEHFLEVLRFIFERPVNLTFYSSKCLTIHVTFKLTVE